MSLVQLQNIPSKSLILLVGSPGSGKTTFCHQTVINSIDAKPVIFVTTENPPSKIEKSLIEKGLGINIPHSIGYVDAFHETMGLKGEERADTVTASCENLTSLGVAITKLKRKVQNKFLLIFDSLTSPYIFTGSDTVKFLKKILSKLAAEGNSILVSIDEGCGREEDLIAMMSSADGIVKIELTDGSKTFNVIKHPKFESKKFNVERNWDPDIKVDWNFKLHQDHTLWSMGLMSKSQLRKEVGDYVHIFWLKFAYWSSMLWDPKRFPTMSYRANKQMDTIVREAVKYYPLKAKIYLRYLMPRSFSKVKDMKRLMKRFSRLYERDCAAITEYDEHSSKTDEHYLRLYESAICWGFENIGATLHLGTLGAYAGGLSGFEKAGHDWNIVETKCIGLGDPYCELKIVPGEIDELDKSLTSIDNTVIERIHNHLHERLMGYILYDRPLFEERPRLGNSVGLHAFSYSIQVPAIYSERYRIATRLGGFLAGKRVGRSLVESGMNEDEAVKRMIDFINYCKVGKISLGKTLRMLESCESFTIKAEIPYCFFTTGFLNGFFASVRDQHVVETKCIAMGDPYCEWELKKAI